MSNILVTDSIDERTGFRNLKLYDFGATLFFPAGMAEIRDQHFDRDFMQLVNGVLRKLMRPEDSEKEFGPLDGRCDRLERGEHHALYVVRKAEFKDYYLLQGPDEDKALGVQRPHSE